MFADWTTWRPVYEKLTLARDGERQESDFAQRFNFDERLPNLVQFWRLHVCPATNRPANIYPRFETADVFRQLMMTNYNLILTLGHAAAELQRINAGDLGENTAFSVLYNFIMQAGNAVTLFRSVQEDVSEIVTTHGPGPFTLFPKPEFKANWAARHARVMYHRNAITHGVRPQVFADRSTSTRRFLMFHHRHADTDAERPCPERLARMIEPERHRFDTVQSVCTDLYADSLSWLDDIYAETVRRLEPILAEDWYLRLRGWDTRNLGRHPPPPRMYLDSYGGWHLESEPWEFGSGACGQPQ